MADLKSEAKNVASTKRYADIDFRFKPHPVTGDVTIKYDSDAITRAVRNIVLTNFYERPFKPSLGSSIRNQLFELSTDRKVNRMAKKVQKVIEDFEPRVENVKVLLGDVSDRNELNVTIFYNIKNSAQTQEMDFTVNRAR
jgi:phage baseplate assembly protein W